ncbi:hypothetical protein CERSUDRAFT_156346 [Gelatoporia subvermispora B]|uniref:Fe2OG dioxygenase domain-containing protein n=1 Tax=Ceriporiopsis subvermispora (strain B) TaxID=914234 RepID=M2RCT0_CERS8|nr:hypothetical protein CERSUDRAFT_156346 [Gelatoporia subvermispora B]
MFFGKDYSCARRMDFANTQESQLRDLAELCEPASFGRNNEDVLDENYRKASKLDSAYFSLKFDPLASGLLDLVRLDLLDGGENDGPIRAELYKLNVYGPGSFFKPHKDTPRGEDMFGSLVLIFPTMHDGGLFQLRHEGEEWCFDSGKVLAASDTPSIGYAAFFSDVEHEITPVVSGYRITVTYNLFYSDPEVAPASGSPASTHRLANEASFRSAMVAALNDQSWVPSGTLVGFGLRHQYPIDKNHPQKTELGQLEGRLKGGDRMVVRVLKELGLNCSIKALYEFGRDLVMVDRVVELERELWPGCDPVSELQDAPTLNAKVLLRDDSWDDENEVGSITHATWATPYTSNNRFAMPFATYGNEASLDWGYVDLCLIAEVSIPSHKVPNPRRDLFGTDPACPTRNPARDDFREVDLVASPKHACTITCFVGKFRGD